MNCLSRHGLAYLIPPSRTWIAPSLSLCAWKRFYSISHDVEHHPITCGLSGQIIVELHNASLVRSSLSAPLVIYLPPYPSSSLHSPPSWLLRNFPVLSIPYRWSHNPSVSFRIQKTHGFPVPLHDTLQAYTWLLNSYLPSLSTNPPPSSSSFHAQKPIQRPLLIYGSYLGGTLATSLALTESYAYTNRPTHIHSLVVYNAILDWTPFSTTPDPVLFDKSSIPSYISSPELYSQKPWTTDTLHTLKTRLFPSPSQTFDAFASPLLFFRRPGTEVPKRWPIPPPSPNSTSPSSSSSHADSTVSEDFPVSNPEDAPSHYLEDFTSPDDPDESDFESPPSNFWDDELEEHPHESLQKSRKSHLIFPPRNSLLRLPRSLFLYSASSTPDMVKDGTVLKGGQETSPTEIQSDEEGEMFDVFKEQAEEMQKLMKRSIMMHELGDRIRWDEDCDAEAISGERVSVRSIGLLAVEGGGDRIEEDRDGKTGKEEGEEEAEVGRVVKGWLEEGGL
ncbi:hypothetical protein ACMFMG_005923 [Clarireedia jacksonii]